MLERLIERLESIGKIYPAYGFGRNREQEAKKLMYIKTMIKTNSIIDEALLEQLLLFALFDIFKGIEANTILVDMVRDELVMYKPFAQLDTITREKAWRYSSQDLCLYILKLLPSTQLKYEKNYKKMHSTRALYDYSEFLPGLVDPKETPYAQAMLLNPAIPEGMKLQLAAERFDAWMNRFEELHRELGHLDDHNKALLDFLNYARGFKYVKTYEEFCQLSKLVRDKKYKTTVPPCLAEIYNLAVREALIHGYEYDEQPTEAIPKLSTLCFEWLQGTSTAHSVQEQNVIMGIKENLISIGYLKK